MLQVDFVTLFPEMVQQAVDHSILKRAKAAGFVDFRASNPRDFSTDNHHTVDDKPFGGGAGMLMMAEPVAQAIESLMSGLVAGSADVPSAEPGSRTQMVEGETPSPALRGRVGVGVPSTTGLEPRDTAVVFTDPTGELFTQAAAQELSQKSQVVFVCGHYEGIDDRVREAFATHVFSIGDFVLTNGELPALVMADAVVRLLPGALGSPESLEQDSHNEGLLSAPQFTRPEVWRGIPVPEIVRSGDHAKLAKWKRAQALNLTRTRRPDLFARADLKKGDLDLTSDR